jgi:hypothetical protein
VVSQKEKEFVCKELNIFRQTMPSSSSLQFKLCDDGRPFVASSRIRDFSYWRSWHFFFLH